MKIILVLLLGMMVFGCKPQEDKAPATNDPVCPTSENFVSHDLIFNMNPGQKLSNRFHVNGITTGEINLSSIRFYMSTNFINSITVKIYSGAASGDPEAGTLLNTTTKAITNGSGSVTNPVEIPLSSPVTLKVDQPAGDSYFVVLEPTPGSYSISYTLDPKISGSRIDSYDSGTWYHGSQYDDNLSMVFSYSGCTFW